MYNAILAGHWNCAVVVAVALSVGDGCVAARGTAHSDTLLPAANPYDADVPVPAGFRLVDEASEDWSNGSARYLRHRYRGRADKSAVRTFYREQMPLVRWTPISDGNVHGSVTMRFQRDGESCTITIEQERYGLTRYAAVDVLIVPKAP